MIPVIALVVGIVTAAALDHRFGWGTVVSVVVALYCHRLYRRPVTELPYAPARPMDDELRPGWAARWDAAPSIGETGVCGASSMYQRGIAAAEQGCGGSRGCHSRGCLPGGARGGAAGGGTGRGRLVNRRG